MSYVFNLIGISPILEFFQHQQENPPTQTIGPAYIGTQTCHLDAFISSIETIPKHRGWDLDDVVDAVIHYWMSNEDSIRHWRDRLLDAGDHNLLIGRIANYRSLQTEFESLLG